ncbi:ricin-type beta-trefoil lectin domain protein [Kitasatospora sp. NPDC004799]|uniref:ricin-type beta-trefoil lectin domain protein n=1 Tax=Kitasatospora sp. NPDC004799 TaxID=3154460 RepID=UPI0033A6184E
MFTIKKAAACAAAALAATGATAAAGPAPAGQAHNAGQLVRFYNEAVNGVLDSAKYGPVAIAWQANGTVWQNWVLRPTSLGYLLEAQGKPDKCLQAYAEPGTEIPLVECNVNIPTQHWQLDRTGDKVVIAQATDEDYVIAAQSNGNPVVKAFRDNSPRQLWLVSAPS